MNCKRGDLARVLGPVSGPNRDRIVRCVRLLSAGEEVVLGDYEFAAVPDDGYWLVEGRLVGEIDNKLITVPGGPIRDVDLRPIRDPGEDAQDETLSWLPVPEHDEVAA